jgi:hypothetical protein
MIYADKTLVDNAMKKKLINLHNYKPEVNELGEIKIDTSVPKRKHSYTPKGFLKFLGYLILIAIIILGFILPSFIPTNQQKEEPSTETE